MEDFSRSNFVPSAVTGYTDNLKAGDFNGDGNIDFIVGRINNDHPLTPSSSLQLFLGNGRGGFSDASSVMLQGDLTMSYVARNVVGDFNGDGIDDIFLIDTGIDVPPYTGGQNKLFLSDASTGKLVNATDRLPQKVLSNHGASAGDTTGTGKLDILVNALMHDGNQLLLNDGKGQFTQATSVVMPNLTIAASWNPALQIIQTNTMSAFIDVNNDGHVDMVLGGWYSASGVSKSQIILNDGKGNFTKSAPVDLPNSGVQKESIIAINAIDLNGDELPDLVMSITNGDEGSSFYHKAYLQLLVNDGNGKFHDETQLRLPQSTSISDAQTWYKQVRVVDLDHDGNQDIVAFDFSSNPATILLSDDAGRFSTKIALPGGTGVGEVTDVDNSGMLDLITRSQGKQGFDVWTNNLVNHHIYEAAFGGGALTGSTGNDTFIAAHRGKNVFIGNGGMDTLKLSGTSSGYSITKSSNGLSVKSDTIDVTAHGIDRIIFDGNAGLAFDADGSAGKVFRLYTAAFDRTADADGLGFWMKAMDNQVSLDTIASGFIGSPEFESMYGSSSSNQTFVSFLYQHVLHRSPDQQGSDFWVDGLDHGASRAEILTAFSESLENVAQVASIVAAGVHYQA